MHSSSPLNRLRINSKTKEKFYRTPKRREIETETDREILQIQCVRKEFLWYNRRVEMSNKTKNTGCMKRRSDQKWWKNLCCECVFVCVCSVHNSNSFMGAAMNRFMRAFWKKKNSTENIRNVKAEFTFCWLLERCLSKHFSFYTSVHRLYTNVFENIVGFKCKGIIALVSCICRQSLLRWIPIYIRTQPIFPSLLYTEE